MAKNKLEKFAELKTFKNVLEFNKDFKGKWEIYFSNNNNIVLELACGRGEYTLGLAMLYCDKNFIGFDIKGNRIWAGAKFALANGLHNAAFLRARIDDVENYFETDEVAEIWITFPDPFLRKSKLKKRLTHPKFLRKYFSFLKQSGKVNLKTDSPFLYNFTKNVIELFGLKLLQDYNNLYAIENIVPDLSIKTYYEGLNISKSNQIFFLQFELNVNILDTTKDADLKEQDSNK